MLFELDQQVQQPPNSPAKPVKRKKIENIPDVYFYETLELWKFSKLKVISPLLLQLTRILFCRHMIENNCKIALEINRMSVLSSESIFYLLFCQLSKSKVIKYLK